MKSIGIREDGTADDETPPAASISRYLQHPPAQQQVQLESHLQSGGQHGHPQPCGLAESNDAQTINEVNMIWFL